NLIHHNGEEIRAFEQRVGRQYFEGHYNIGMWNWELSSITPEWDDYFAGLDEVWAPSQFTRDSIATRSPVPVHWMPYCVPIPDQFPAHVTRQKLGVPDRAFCFLFAFDTHSTVARKNPLAVIR